MLGWVGESLGAGRLPEQVVEDLVRAGHTREAAAAVVEQVRGAWLVEGQARGPRGGPSPGMPIPVRAEPHRGVLTLVLGILGLVLCPICGVVAWVLANSDLAQMRAGNMDPAGEGLTTAGRILGIISVVLALVGLVLTVPILILAWYLIYGWAATPALIAPWLVLLPP